MDYRQLLKFLSKTKLSQLYKYCRSICVTHTHLFALMQPFGPPEDSEFLQLRGVRADTERGSEVGERTGEGWLRELGLFSLQKRLRENLIALCNSLKKKVY